MEKNVSAVLTVHDRPMYTVCLVLSTVGETSDRIVVNVTSNAY